MSLSPTHLSFLEYLNKALKTQGHYAQDHPQCIQALSALQEVLGRLLAEQSPLNLTVNQDQIDINGEPATGAPHASASLAGVLATLGIETVTFWEGFDEDDLQLLFFTLLMPPQRAQELGGPRALLPAGGAIDLLLTGETPEFMARPGTVELPPRILADDLSGLLTALVQMTSAPVRPDPKAPWTMEQREMLSDYEFRRADLSGLLGMGAQLGLEHLEPSALRLALRQAVTRMDPREQAALLLGLTGFPPEEASLRLAFDYLAPELLATALADAWKRRPGSRMDLSLAASALLHCVKDRDLAMEALKGHLMLQGWSMDDTESLEEAIRWECHGTDTKLHLTLKERSAFELDPHQLAILVRQLLRGRKVAGLRDLLHQLETGLTQPHVERRRLAAETLADMARCIESAQLPPEFETRILQALQTHLEVEQDSRACQWAAHGLEALLTHWLHACNFTAVYAQMLALGQLVMRGPTSPDWKIQLVRDLLARLASPPNLALLAPLIHQRDGDLAIPQLHALLTLFGRPAASYLLVCLEVEEDRTRRAHLLGALGAIGSSAAIPLVDALASPHWYLVRNALSVLETINHRPAFPHAVLALTHREPRVRRAAIRAVARLGEQAEASLALGRALEDADPETQLDLLATLGDLQAVGSVISVANLVTRLKGAQGDAARVRLRAVETLGRLGQPEAIPVLQDLFRKKGLLGSREGSSIRLTAVKALAAIPTREAREALTLVLDLEPDEELRSAIRKVLVN